ncbi:hypothetical protein MOQ_003857 [Trypanosoma cruzi marinkellei]|uniref:Uncharacterized protein n=1 Tax=Trypanosoma cruzi marinkellei TaxID=85056 RepID=K2NBN2_TRYCR|nr:hypothetical protein MOQ_003857 [Trypanosoma cruzi marinkellei]
MGCRRIHRVLQAKEEENKHAREAFLTSWRAEYQQFLQNKLAALVWHVEHHCRSHVTPQTATLTTCGEMPRMKVTTTTTNSTATASTNSNNAMLTEDAEQHDAYNVLAYDRNSRMTPLSHSFPEETPLSMPFYSQEFTVEKEPQMFLQTNPPSTVGREVEPCHDGQHFRTELNASKAEVKPLPSMHKEETAEPNNERDNDRTAMLVVSPPPRKISMHSSSLHIEDDGSLNASLSPSAATAAAATNVPTRTSGPAVQLQKMLPTDEISKENLRKTIARLYGDSVDTRSSCSDTWSQKKQRGLSTPPPPPLSASHMMHVKTKHVCHGASCVNVETSRNDMMSKKQLICELRRLYGLEDER